MKKVTCFFSMLMTALSFAADAIDCLPDELRDNPASNFEIRPNGTALHIETGLVWDSCFVGQTGADCSGGEMNFGVTLGALHDILLTRNAENYKGGSNWRVPTVKELMSVQDSACYPNLPMEVFPVMRGGAYFLMSSTLMTDDYAPYYYYGAYLYGEPRITNNILTSTGGAPVILVRDAD